MTKPLPLNPEVETIKKFNACAEMLKPYGLTITLVKRQFKVRLDSTTDMYADTLDEIVAEIKSGAFDIDPSRVLR